MSKPRCTDILAVVTHAGSFHADELMAVVLLQRFFLAQPLVMSLTEDDETHKQWISGKTRMKAGGRWFEDGVEDCRTPLPIIRTRNAKVLALATAQPNVMVIDVGGVHNERMLNFDHHQRNMAGTWPDGLPLSSTGLVWLWLKKHGLLPMRPEIIQELETTLIRPLDAHDNGVASFALSIHVKGYGRGSGDGPEQHRQFFKALGMMDEALNNAWAEADMKLEAKAILEERWKRAVSKGQTSVLVPRTVAYSDCATLLGQISDGKADMIILQGLGNKYSIKSLNVQGAFSSKHLVPEAWRGNTNFDVHVGNRPIRVAFAHKTGFMCVVEGTPQDAFDLASYVVDHNTVSTPKLSR